MSPIPLRRPGAKLLVFVLICSAVIALIAFAAMRQHAAGSLSRDKSNPNLTLAASEGRLTPAAALIVNSLSDVANGNDGLCTLREAITKANGNFAGGPAGECAATTTGPDTISFSVTGTINLTGALPDINRAMNIVGPGSSQLTVRRDTGGDYRIFTIFSGPVSISGLTVTNGKSADGASGTSGSNGQDGGGIRNFAVLTLNDVVVTGNQAGAGGAGVTTGGFGGKGGGVYNSGTLTMTNCTVSGNTAGRGGDANFAGDGGLGGGVFNITSLTMTTCVVDGNQAGRGGDGSNGGPGGDGGGIFGGYGPSGGPVTLSELRVTNNVAGDGGNHGSTGSGGGIFLRNGSLTISKSTVSGNSTGTVSGSGGYGVGGGIGVLSVATMQANGITVSGNTSAGSGGGVAVSGSVVVRMVNSTISGNTGVTGGGVWNDAGTTELTNCTVTGNSASSGNGFSSSGFGGPARVRNTIIAGNGPGGAGPDVSGSFTTRGNNLIGTGGTGFTNGVSGDQAGSPGSPLNPQLGPLANNGGSTQTHALLSTSPALDAGDNCVTDAAHCSDAFLATQTTDQRGSGFSRQVDGPDVDTTATVDIGAYETQVSLADLTDTSTNEDTQLLVPFDVGDGSTVASVTASSSNPGLVPNDVAHLSVAVSGASVVLTINPATNQVGTTDITVTVNRTVGGPDVKTFMLTVNPVNDAPSFTKGADQTVNEDSGAQTVNNWATSISAGSADESGQVLTFQITGNTSAALFSVAPAISSTGTLTYTPAADASGSATITVSLMDNGGTANGGVDTSASQTFTITVNSVNDAPSFTKGADQTVNEDSGAQTVSNWATGLSAGPSNESGQTLTFQVTNNTNASLFSAGPAVSSTGTLTYTPAANANGSATITLVIKDSGGTLNGGVDTSASQTFTITVNSVNDVPSFTKGANQTVNEDSGAQTVNNWATAISAGPANESGQTVSFNITGNTNAALFSAGPAISPTGSLTYTPAVDANGSATITLLIKDDGGTANGGIDTSASQTFTITLNAVNDAPSFTKGADQTVNNNAGAQTVNNWATNISSGPANESGQTLTFQITGNTNTTLFSAGPAVSSTGTLTYTPAANAGGTATITIQVQDNGGTTNGGVNTSPPQTFNITVNAVGGTIVFSAATYNATESSGFTTVTVTRTGSLAQAVSVDYSSSGNNSLPCSTANGVATPKCDFTTALGTLTFAAGENTKTVNILISQDSFVEGPETFTVALSNPTGNSALGTTSTATTTIADDVTELATNPIDDVRNFVRQHYHDFLNREPDTSGWDFWTNQITSCGSDVQCNEVRRVDVSASFFLSIEFQQSGYLVERFYKVGYGDAVGTSTFVSNHQLNVPIVRFNEFLKDTQRIGQGVIVLQPGWEQALENNKQAYALEFVQTSRFVTAFPTTMTPAQFVDRLNQNVGGVLSLAERQTAIDLFGGAANSSNNTARAQAVRMVADDADLYSAEFNRAFVLAEYFGYLRRNPNDAPDSDYTGYDFWLTKLNQFNGSYINAEMVKAFLSSIEYRQRFGP